MQIWQSIVLGIVEGITEFLPISSTGHLTVVEKLMGFHIDDKAITGFTAVIQVGAIVAVIVYFWTDIVRIVADWLGGVFDSDRRRDPGYRFGWIIIVGTIPVLVVGLAAHSLITGPLRNLWWVAGALIVWSFVMLFAEWVATQRRHEPDMNLRDGWFVGALQCFSLIPGVSRSGATISAGLYRGLDRVAATRLAFFLSIPALLAAGVFELPDALSGHVGAAPTIVGTIVSFVVAYVVIAWFLRFVARHTLDAFVIYRFLVAFVVIGLLVSNTVTAH